MFELFSTFTFDYNNVIISTLFLIYKCQHKKQQNKNCSPFHLQMFENKKHGLLVVNRGTKNGNRKHPLNVIGPIFHQPFNGLVNKKESNVLKQISR